MDRAVEHLLDFFDCGKIMIYFLSAFFDIAPL